MTIFRSPLVLTVTMIANVLSAGGASAQACTDSDARRSEFIVSRKVDQFEQQPFWETQPRMLTGSKLNLRAAQVILVGQVRYKGPSDAEIQLIVRYKGRGPLDIPEGESLIFRADSTVIALSTKGSDGTRQKKSHEKEADQYSETAQFPISLEQLEAVSAADELAVRIVGEGRNVDLVVGKDTKCTLRRLYLVAIAPPPA